MKKFGPVVFFYTKAISFRSAFVLFILFCFAGFTNKTFAQPGAAWGYSRVITMSAGTPVADYQVQVILTAGQYTDMNADGSDLRFYDGAITCNFWIEKWNTSGQSVIWVKVPVAGTSSFTMYYGNPAATSLSDGTTTFDFFDDFDGPLNTSVWDATVGTSGSLVTLQNGDFLSNKIPFPIANGSSYYLETKHNEGSYYRVRYYATTTTGVNGSNSAIIGVADDYGYFTNAGNPTIGNVYWQGSFNQPLTAGIDYITQWQITDNTHFRWNTLESDYTPVATTNYLPLVAVPFRYITIAVTEATASTAVDWIRVRKSAGSDASGNSLDPAVTGIGSQVQLAPTITSFTNPTLCYGGTITTVITGDNFDHTSSVTFNGVAAQSFTIDSRTQITATSQAGVTGGAITITTPGGSVTSANLVVNPLPNLFTVGGGGHYCAGGTGLPITLSASQMGISYQLLQNATAVGTPLTGNGPALTFLNQTANAAYTVVSTDISTGCIQNMTGAPTVVIDPLPAQYNVIGAGNFCSGGTGIIVGLNGSQASVKYQLLLGGSPVGAPITGSGSALNFGLQTAAGSYTVTAAYSTGTTCSNNMLGSAEVSVNPLPTGTIGVTETSGNGPANDGKICRTDPITFTAPPGYVTYVFKLNGTPVGAQPVPNVYTTSALPPGSPIVTVEVTDVNGCHGTFSTSVPVSVSTLPIGSFAPSTNNVCPGISVTFNAPSSPNYVKYIFSVNGGTPVYTGPLSSYSSNTLANGDVVSVEVTNNNGCTTTFAATPMIIKPLPDAAGAITGTAELCAGTNYVTYSVPAITNATSYVWTLPGGATGSSTGSSISVNFSDAATTGNITVAGVNGCGNGTSSSFQVIVDPLPTLQITDPAPVCSPSTVDLTAAAVTSGSTTGLTFTYFKDAAGTVSLPSPNSIAVSGTYYIKGTTVNGCADIIKPVVVIVNSLPTLQITDPAPVCSSNSVDLTASAVTAGSTAGLTFTYFTDAAGMNVLPSPGAVMAPGTYYIKGTSTTGCSDVIKPVVVTINPLPTAGIGPDANTAECLNSIIQPGVIFTGAGGTAPYTFTYTVNGGGNQTVSTTSGNSVTVYQPTTTAGTFTYTLVSVKDNSSTQCANAQNGSVDVIIHELPVPVLTGPDQICPDQTLDYSTQTGQSNYIWTINGGALNSGGGTSDPTAQVHWNNDNLPKSIYVNYTDANGCSGVTSVSVISTLPTTPTFNPSGEKIVCLNSTGKTYEVQSGYTDYVWLITGGTITSGGGTNDYTATVTWNSAGPQTISVNFNSGTCSAPAPTAYPVTVNTLPTATVTTNNTFVCQNGTAPIITFTGADGAANYTFSYTINGTPQPDIVSSGNSQTVTLETPLTPGDFIYKLTKVGDNYTCSQTQTDEVKVTVHPLPTAIISGSTAVCKDAASPEITFTGADGTAPYTFTYKIGTGSNQTVTTFSGNSVTVSASTGTAGTFDYNLVSVEDVFGCTQTATQTATVTVNPLPTATMTGPAALCLNDAGNITFTGGNGTEPYTFNYSLDGSNQTIATSAGNSVTVPITTTSAHTFTYQLISVQDGPSTTCAQNQPETVTVIVSAVSVGGTLTGNNTVCTGVNSGTINLGIDKVGNVIRWEYSIDGGTSWNTVTPNNNSTSLTYTNLIITTQYRAIVQSGTCIEAPSNAVTITVNTAAGGTVDHGPSGTGTVCAGATGSVILTGNSGPVLHWAYSTDGTNFIIDASKKDTFYNFINIAQTTWYKAYSQASPCAAIYSTTYKVTVNPRPGATIDASPNPICIGGSTTLTLNLTGSGPMAGTLTETDGTNTITNNYPFSGTSANPVVLTGITPATSSTYTISTLADANCPARVADLPNYVIITVNPLPAPVVITPGNTTICSGTVLPLSSVENHSGNFIIDQASSINNVPIPDDDLTGVSNTISVPLGTIPVGGVVDSIDVVMNVQHPEVLELAINLGAPNGKIITLFAPFSLSGPNLTGTSISSRTTQYPVITTGSTPYTGKYTAEGDNPYGAQSGNANTRKFSDLFGTTIDPPNGDWKLYLTDNFGGDQGTLQDWSLKIYYHVPVNPISIVWSPVDSLFTDPSATMPYTGDARQTVYAKPSATTTYTGRSTDPNTCTTASDVTITVTPAPAVIVKADYCAVPNKVQLTAISVPAASSYIWNTGETTSVIAVDEAKLYTVAATTGLHCVGTGFLSIAQELVKNGDFEANNTAFYTQYGYVAPPANQTGAGSLQLEGLYAVDTNANNYHTKFFGKDHTTPDQTGKFMIVNGDPGTGVIWQETVSVLPNTNYYYSAWAMNLNDVPTFARLQFAVNGVPIGTIAELGDATVPKPTSPADVNINNWVRFYYGASNGWNSGSATTAVIQIIDLNTVKSGNDFGLDDISFATLSTFITLTSAPETDKQTVCRGDEITDITYTVGSGGTPTVTGLPNGVTYDFKNGIRLIISGTPDDISKVYTYTITTTGSCLNPTTATGTITVNGQKVALSSLPGTDAQIVCKGAPISPIKYTLGELATNAVVTGLPNGVTASAVSGKAITITGSPLDSGTFTYKIKTTGSSCNADSLEGTIRSNVQTIAKTSGDDNQKLCVNDKDIDPIIYKIGGTGTNAMVTTLPAGLTGEYSGGSFTISGKPLVAGVVDYTITTDGTCEAAAITGKITVLPNATVSLGAGSNDAQIICYNGSIDNIIYNTSGALDASVLVTGLPDGLDFTVNSGVVTITGTPTKSGTFNYTVKAIGPCVEATKGGTITIDPLVNTGTSFTANYSNQCSTPAGTLTLNGSSGTISGWEYSTDGGTNWLPTNPASTTDVLPFTVNTTTYFKVIFDGGVCGDSYSSPYVIGVHNLWTGAVSTNWNDANNWSDGNLPSTSCPDVMIPQVPTNRYPVLATGTATITNLHIDANASVTVNGSGKLQIGGSVTNLGVFDVTVGTIEFNGVSAQNIDGNTFKNSTIQNLIVSNTNTLSVVSTSGDTLKISGDLTFGTANGSLNTGNNITLLSSALATANVGVLKATNSIVGDVIVERYVAALNNWQFLAIPTQTNQTINAAWQEGQTPGNVGPIGYGTNITGPVFANGMDFKSPSPSLKYWDNTSQVYVNIDRTETKFPQLQNGYFLYVRGDRQATNILTTPHVPTVMRTKGKLNTGSINLSVPGNAFSSLGNPYASRVDFRNIAGIGGIGSTFYVWDPLIPGTYGVGGYQTLSQTNGYKATIPGTVYYVAGALYPYLESGQAFFVNNTGGSPVTLTFNESAKTTGSHLVFRGGEPAPSQFFRTYLYTSSGKIVDGSVVAFNSIYHNKVDLNDAIKISNMGENLGLKREGIILAIEARSPVVENDTVYFNLKNVAKQTYRLQFNPEDMGDDGLEAYLIDNYLKTKMDVSLSGISSSDFTVNSDAGSYAADRFMIVFKQSDVLPVTFVSVTASQVDKNILVGWNVQNENMMQQYDVEKSVDAINFVKNETLAALNSGTASYQWTDQNALPGNNYYRIRSVDKSGKVVYSTVAKVSISNFKTGISIYPNPITDAVIHLQFVNQPQGKYRIRLLDPLGQVILAKQIEYAGGNGSEDIKWDYKMAHGMYQLEIIKPDQSVHIIKVLY